MLRNLSQAKSSILGFTLIELIISVAIIVIISAVGIAGFNSANRNTVVKAQAQELKTLFRKIRTDAGAAVKPSGDCSTAGTVYGTYVTFRRNTSSVTYGISCFDPPPNSSPSNYSSSNTLQLKQGLLQGSPLFSNASIFYGFDGEVKIFDFSALPGKTQPTRDDILNVPSVLVNFLPVIVTEGSSIGTGVRRKVSMNRNGLICDESNLSAFTSPCSE